MPSKTFNIYAGLALMAFSIGGFFWYGIHFHVFGGKFRLDLITLGFVSWLLLGCFGSGFIRGGILSGLKSVGAISLMLMAALAIGIALGHYR